MNPNIKNEGKETRFKPGQSGNPAGRPPRKPISDRMYAHLERLLGPEVRKSLPPAIRAAVSESDKYADALVISFILNGIKRGDAASFELALEAVEGKKL